MTDSEAETSRQNFTEELNSQFVALRSREERKRVREKERGTTYTAFKGTAQ